MPETLPVWYAFSPRDKTPERVVPITTAAIDYLRSQGLYENTRNRCIVRTFDGSFQIGLGDPLRRDQLAAIDRIIKEAGKCQYKIELNGRELGRK